MTPKEIENLQRALIAANYSVGPRGADGKWGSATKLAMQRYQKNNGLKVTDMPDAATIGKLMPKPAAPLKPAVKQTWPKQSQCDAYYGNPRGPRDASKVSQTWEAANLTTIKPPFRMTYDGKPISTIRIHKRCADSLLRVLNAIWIAAGRDQSVVDAWGVSIYGGAFNYRLMRGAGALSMHSYGCAIDLDPARNGFGDKTPHFATVPEVLKAFADEGWTWGGKWSKPDGMHWQAALV